MSPNTNTRRDSRDARRGSALVVALVVLGFIAVMGVTMLGYVAIDKTRQNNEIDAERAAWVARSGIEAAVAELQTNVASGQAPAPQIEVDVPVYWQPNTKEKQTNPASDAPEVDDRFKSRATVAVADESARINVNLAPPTVLMSVLKIDGDKARLIREKLPRIDGAAPTAEDANRHWLTGVDDLVSRQLLTSESLTAERAADLTVYTAMDSQSPTATINLNTASSAVIEAALGVTPDIAAKVIAARPLNSVDALKTAAGKDPSGFNFKPPADNPAALPKELGFSSRCFRLVSRADVHRAGGEGMADLLIASATIEAVVQFPENAAPQIVFWNETASARTTGK